MTPDALVDELKVRARIRRNRARREAGESTAAVPSLRDHLHGAAREVGFVHWEHARQVLGGHVAPIDDMGSFWHAPGTGLVLHHWFARHEEATPVLAAQREGFLLPYRRQCFIVQSAFIEALGLDPADAAWQAIGRDLVAGYGTPAWRQLAARRIRAPLASFEPRLSSSHANKTHRPI